MPWKQLNASGIITDSNDEPVAACLTYVDPVIVAVNSYPANQQLIHQLIEALRVIRKIAGDNQVIVNVVDGALSHATTNPQADE